jgi:integrase
LPPVLFHLAPARICAHKGAAFKAVDCGKEKGKGKVTIRGLNKLAKGAADSAGDGSWSDGGGLYLAVSGGGARRSWVFRFTSPATGKVREMGLGRAGKGGVGLAQAREERDRLIALIRAGTDPLAERERRKLEQASKRTFAEAAEAVLAKKQGGWRHGERGTSFQAWNRTLTVEAKGIHQRPVGDIAVAEVKAVVAPLWAKGHLVAARMTLARLSAVFDYAKARGWREGDNPAGWQVFQHLAPERSKAKQHHPALPWGEVPAAVARLRETPGMSPLALEFAILTGARISEALEATWDEIDLEGATWRVPPERMKRGVEHLVPLAARPLAILTALKALRRPRSNLVFPGDRPGRPINRMTVFSLTKRVSDGRASPHGFRSSLRSWLGDRGVEFELAEACLAHAPGDGTVQAYHRTQLLERRRPLMIAWADFLSGEGDAAGAEVIPLAARKA